MANKLLESYKNRVTLAEQLYARRNPGQKLSAENKMIIAQCLDNTRKLI